MGFFVSRPCTIASPIIRHGMAQRRLLYSAAGISANRLFLPPEQRCALLTGRRTDIRLAAVRAGGRLFAAEEYKMAAFVFANIDHARHLSLVLPSV